MTTGDTVEGRRALGGRPQTPPSSRDRRFACRFWNTSGIDVHFGLKGLDVRTGSLESMLAGGVAFATPGRARRWWRG